MDETTEFNMNLFKLLCDDNDDDENLCLITSMPLEDDSIELVCKHRFNYKPLFSEITHQKNYNKLETTKLKPREIKCPYCRTIQMGLIPPCKRYPDLLLIGVNSPNRMIFKGNKCTTVIKSGKRKGQLCNKACYGKNCTYHNTYSTKKKADVLCNQILKRGLRKGKQCGCRCTKENNIKSQKCSKHFKNLEKNIVNNLI